MKVLIVIGSIFLYMLFGYVYTTVLLALGEDSCESIAPWITTDDPDFCLFLGCTVWPFTIVITILITFCKVIDVIGTKLSVLPVTIALLIKYMIEKNKEGKKND